MKEILAGLAVVIVILAILVAIFGTGNYIAHENNMKQQHMNELCISKGFTGWNSGTGSNNYGVSGCVGG